MTPQQASSGKAVTSPRSPKDASHRRVRFQPAVRPDHCERMVTAKANEKEIDQFVRWLPRTWSLG